MPSGLGTAAKCMERIGSQLPGGGAFEGSIFTLTSGKNTQRPGHCEHDLHGLGESLRPQGA